MSSEPGRLLTARELAALLSVSTRSVRKWRATGRLPRPIVLAPRVLRWRASDVETWLASLADKGGATRGNRNAH